jgi:hypothetical protein
MRIVFVFSKRLTENRSSGAVAVIRRSGGLFKKRICATRHSSYQQAGQPHRWRGAPRELVQHEGGFFRSQPVPW